jgi:signal transduction histidine kinase
MFLAQLWLFIEGNRTIAARTKALERLSSSLEEKVRERTLELATSRRLADVGRLAAGVAHEINTPLASIATCAEGLIQRTEDPTVRRYLEVVRKEAFRVKSITKSLLDFSRSQPELENPSGRRSVPVVSAIREVLDFLTFSLEEKGIETQIVVEPQDLSVLAEPAAFHQIILNLTTNSIDALPNGGLIRWEAHARGDSVQIKCQDDGVGIRAELLPEVIDPFVTTKTPGDRAGLGLSVAWSLTRRQSGTLTIDSPGENQGTTTTLLLPRG